MGRRTLVRQGSPDFPGTSQPPPAITAIALSTGTIPVHPWYCRPRDGRADVTDWFLTRYASPVGDGSEVHWKGEHGSGIHPSFKQGNLRSRVTRLVNERFCRLFVSRERIQARCHVGRNGNVNSPRTGARASHKRERGTRLRNRFACATDSPRHRDRRESRAVIAARTTARAFCGCLTDCVQL